VKVRILNKLELSSWVRSLNFTAVVSLLLGGDRFYCCDEGVAVEVGGEIVAIATIAPHGEDRSGQPTIVAVYVPPQFRGKGYSKAVMEAVIKRCQERGFKKVRIEVMSKYLMNNINSLPEELRDVLDIIDAGDIMDAMPG